MTTPALSFLANHLWQSTLVAAAAALLTLAFRNNRAHVRYWIWLTASIKFLVPFAALVTIGRQFGWRSAAPVAQLHLTFVMDAVSQPFSRTAIPMAAGASPDPLQVSVVHFLPLAFLAIWSVGFAAILLTWIVRWRRVAATVREATPVRGGRELDALRRLEALGGITRPMALVSSDEPLEPGVFGILNPVLVWPRRMSAHLAESQVDAILAHEVSHVRRRDNLAAGVHMLVQAAFWFHPLVWWLGVRIVDERERACDEDVVRLGNEPQVYAESILKTCQFCLESPIACVAGVTGSNLKKRIEQIMRSDAGETLGAWKKTLLILVGITTVACPVVIGAANAPAKPILRTRVVETRLVILRARSNSQSQAVVVSGPAPTFDVASIKPNRSGSNRSNLDLQPGGRFIATNVGLAGLIRVAYGEQGPLPGNRLSINPTWIGGSDDHFDIEAKASGELTRAQLPPALQAFLADRFKLAVHHEARELPMYALVLARTDGRLGPRLRRSDVDCSDPDKTPPPAADGTPSCGFRSFPGKASGRVIMADLAMRMLSAAVEDHRPVEDRTGLAGTFEFDLEWTPDRPAPARPADAPPAPPVDPNGSSLFTALKEQLGLALEAENGHIDILVVDRAERPTEN